MGNVDTLFYVIIGSQLNVNFDFIATNGTQPCNIYVVTRSNGVFIASNVLANGIFIAFKDFKMDVGASLTGMAYTITKELEIKNNIIIPCLSTTCAPVYGACCKNEQCYFITQTNCTSLNGTFNPGATSCNNTVCQNPIVFSNQCFINNVTNCITYFSYYSYNTLNVTINSPSNNYILCNGTNLGNVGQPTKFLPGNNTRVWGYNSIGCKVCDWRVRIAA